MKSREIHIFGGLLDGLILIRFGSEADVAADRPAEEERVLQHDAEAAAQVGEVHVFRRRRRRSGRRLSGRRRSAAQGDEGGLARASVADDGDGFAGLDGEGDVAENPVRDR